MFPLMNLQFTTKTMNQVVALLEKKLISNKKGFHVVTANPEIVMKTKRNALYYESVSNSDLITPDGIGIVLASKFLKHPLPERVSGYDLLHSLFLFREIKKESTSIFLIGAEEGIASLAAKNLTSLYPSLRVLGDHHGYFSPNSSEEKSLVKKIGRLKPDLLLVALGAPRQELFIHHYKHQLNTKVLIGVGGAFDILAGKTTRAPVWFQKRGLEWLYRLLKEPSRLSRQRSLFSFFFSVLKEKHKK